MNRIFKVVVAVVTVFFFAAGSYILLHDPTPGEQLALANDIALDNKVQPAD